MKAGFWGDALFRELGDAERWVAVYVLTGPQANRIGAFRFSVGLGAEELGWEHSQFEQAFLSLVGKLGWFWDARARVVVVRQWWKWFRRVSSTKPPRILIRMILYSVLSSFSRWAGIAALVGGLQSVAGLSGDACVCRWR